MPSETRLPAWARSAIALLAAGALIACASSAVTRPGKLVSMTAVAGQAIAVPAYFDPSGSGLRQWNRLLGTARPGAIVVFDVGNLGPGPAPDPAYQRIVARAQAKGIKAVCYVETKAADGVTIRPVRQVETDIDRCYRQYRPAGIFLDEVDGTQRRLGEVTVLARYIRKGHPHALRVLNAGQNTVPGYAGISDILAIFEGPWSGGDYNYQTWRPAPWVRTWIRAHPGGASHFWHMVYAATPATLHPAVIRSRGLGAGYLYVTDGNGDPRWDHLPSYWSGELAAIYR